MADDVRNGNAGPTWKWMVGIAFTIIGVGFAGWMTATWNMSTGNSKDIEDVTADLKSTEREQASIDAQLSKLWEKETALEKAEAKNEWEIQQAQKQLDDLNGIRRPK